CFFFFQAEDGIRDRNVTGVQTCALPISKIVKSQVFGKQFHTICSGGAYLDPSYIDLFKKYDITIQEGYGMTECSPVISTNQKWKIGRASCRERVQIAVVAGRW